MDLAKTHKYRSRVSSLMYVLLNAGLALVAFLTIYVTGSPIFALVLVILGKWRVFSVRPRFWLANVLANLVDVIVSVSFVFLIWAAADTLAVQVALTILHIVWLLVIKPRSKYIFVVIQAGLSLFLGLTTLSLLAYSWDVFFFVATAWLIAYASARHVINHYEEPLGNLYGLVAALICAELAWISYHWMVAYAVPGLGTIKVSQLAIFSLLLGLVAERAANSFRKHGKIRGSDIAMPIALTAMVMIVAYIFAILNGSDAL